MLFCPIYYYQTVKISWGLSKAFMPTYIKIKLLYEIRKLRGDSTLDFTRCKQKNNNNNKNNNNKL